MALSDHLRELRARLLRSTMVVLIAFVVALFFYESLYQLILHPYEEARENLPSGTKSEPVLNGVAAGLTFQLKLCGLAALVGSSPYWLYQIWAFIVPGLHPNERKWSRIFAAIAGPLFFAGVAVGYYVLPKAITVLIGFTPADVTNLVEFTQFFSFISRMLLIFGIAFEIPLFVVMLNLAGVVSGRGAGPLPAMDHHRHLRLRRRRHPVDRPVLDALPRHPDAGPVPPRRGDRAPGRSRPRPRQGLDRAVGGRRGLPAVSCGRRARPVRPAGLAR